MEHIAQRTFTRQSDLQRNILNRWAGSFDGGSLGGGFLADKARKLHHLRRLNAMIRKIAASLRADRSGGGVSCKVRVFVDRVGRWPNAKLGRLSQRNRRNGGESQLLQERGYG
jgi:hypothetical protein